MDHIPCLKAWAENIGGVSFPLLSDFWPHGEIAERYGVLRDDGKSERAIFIIDGEGLIQYIDIHDIDDQPSNEVLFAELRKISPGGPVKPLEQVPDEQEESLPEGEIIMYCNNWCPDCRKARGWLAQHEIEYVEINLARNRKAAQQVREWANGNLVTPTFNIRGTIVVDWDEKRLEELLLG